MGEKSITKGYVATAPPRSILIMATAATMTMPITTRPKPSQMYVWVSSQVSFASVLQSVSGVTDPMMLFTTIIETKIITIMVMRV